MRLKLTRVGLLVELANHYTTRGALHLGVVAIKKTEPSGRRRLRSPTYFQI